MAAEGVIAREGPKPLALGAAVVPLLALAVTIQYVDRGNIATAAPLIKNELGLTATQIGILVSAFYWTYTPGNVLSGWLSHRLNPYRTLALGLTLWSAATFLSGFAGSFAVLLGLRLLLGVGESAFFPCNSRIQAQWVAPARQGAGNGLIGVGMALGPAFGTWAGGNLMAVSGWRASFLFLGAVSILWLIPWRLMAAPALDKPERIETGPAGPSYTTIVRRRDFWGAAIGQFFQNYSFYFLISWMPLYLVEARGFTVSAMAGTVTMIYLVYAVSCWGSGVLADRWMAAGASSNVARKSALVGSGLIVAPALVAAGFADTQGAVVCLVIAAIGNGLGTGNLFAAAQTLAGPTAGGRWMGAQNAIANIAGIVGPMITGAIIDATHGFAWAFISAGAIGVLTAPSWAWLVRRIEPQEWESQATPA
jgi:MFS family permease